MGSLLKLAVSSGTAMNILTAVCCLLITGVLTDLFETEEGNEEFGLQDLTNIQIRNVRETKSRKLRKIKKKSNGKTRRNKKARKGQKRKGKTVKKIRKDRIKNSEGKILNKIPVNQVPRWTLRVFRMPLIYLDMKGIKFSTLKNKKPELKVTIELPITRGKSGTVFRLQPQHCWNPLVEI